MSGLIIFLVQVVEIQLCKNFFIDAFWSNSSYVGFVCVSFFLKTEEKRFFRHFQIFLLKRLELTQFSFCTMKKLRALLLSCTVNSRCSGHPRDVVYSVRNSDSP